MTISFLTEADCSGEFSINNVRAGEYNLYAWGPGFLGDYRYHRPITISPGWIRNRKFPNILTAFKTPFLIAICLIAICFIFIGCDIDVGNLIYEPPRDGPTLWEIGIPDRSAAQFHVPEPDPKYVNQIFINNPKRFGFIYESYIFIVTWVRNIKQLNVPQALTEMI